ncbi:hypothetical protein SNE40_022249 [Patella caerulea]|uniref:Peptidase A2 domain-containing protein n=1 Tax=Patella caerulea TaxID=87958 RepID=A0AAN8G538_PATCE
MRKLSKQETPCRNRKSCGIHGCKRTHHHLFHTDQDSDQQEQISFHTPMSSVLDKASLSPVVRARFRAANGRVRYGNVLVDSGAGTTIIRKEFAESLGLQGIYEVLNLAVVGGEEIEQENSRRVNFWLSGLHSSEEYEIEAHELDKTVINVLPLNKAWLKSFRHLKDIEFTQEEGPLDLNLGVGYSHLHAEEEIGQGREFEPLGKKTRLGWYVIGSDESKQISSVSISFVERVDLNKFYEFETLGIQAPDCHCQEKPISKDDKEALQLFESSCKKEDSRYVTALPWKQDQEFLPNNYPLAFKRLTSLEKGLSKTPTKAELYNKVIEEYERNGWSKRLTKEELEDKEKPSYFLPHHGVYRPEKISTPLRVVFDPVANTREFH